MKIVFLETTTSDLRWFKQYYSSIFPAGKNQANKQYRTFLNILATNPNIGHADRWDMGLREYSIPKMPFTVLYRVQSNRIEILRIFDQRSSRSNFRPPLSN